MRAVFFKLLMSLLCLAQPGWAAALALSDVELMSSLNQPLEARIGLIAVADGDLSGLNVTISGSGEHAGNQHFQTLKHEVMEDGRGHYIRITSSGCGPGTDFNF